MGSTDRFFELAQDIAEGRIRPETCCESMRSKK